MRTRTRRGARSALRTHAALLALWSACAGGPRAAPEEVMPAPLARRVADLLARHHIDPAPGHAELSSRLFEQVWSALGCVRAPSPTLAGERTRLLTALETGDVAFAALAATDCGVPPPPAERRLSLMLDALARSYDPHSRYLGPEALQRFRAQTHARPEVAPAARGQLIAHAGHRIGVVTLPSIYLRAQSSASADLRRVLAALHARGAEVLLLDLRGNGGGVIKEAARVFGVLAGPGPVAQMRRRGQAPETLTAPPEPAAWSGPLLVRIDAGTASVAELLAAALQDSGRALLIGQGSYGKGTGQTLVHLSSPLDTAEGAVDVTDRRFYRLDGRPLQRLGVAPDIALPAPQVPTERTHAGALAADQLAKSSDSFGPMPRTVADSEGVQAAIAYVASPLTTP